MYVRSGVATLALAALAAGLPHQSSPPNGENGDMGGLFGMGVSLPARDGWFSTIAGAITSRIFSLVGYANINIDPAYVIYTGKEYPDVKLTLAEFLDPGTGKYPAHFFTDPSLPDHVIYAPKEPPPENVSMPVLLWGNGGCVSGGTVYASFLTEIASHGYMAIAMGLPGAGSPALHGPTGMMLPAPKGQEDLYAKGSTELGISRIQDMLDAQDWVVKGNAKKYGNVDANSFITAGSSCGGLMAYSAAYKNPRVKLIGVYNSGLIDVSKTPLLKELTARIAYFDGGPKALEYENSQRDYKNLEPGHPAYQASLDTGHLGTFFAKNGGKYASASVDLYEWVFRKDKAARRRWVNSTSPGSLSSQHWDISYKNT